MNTLSNLEEENGCEAEEEGYVQPAAQLVMIHRKMQLQFAEMLDFRPLSPCIGHLKKDSDGFYEIGVWIGSADDTKIRLFRPDKNTGTLQAVLFFNEDNAESQPMTFQAPVMAIDCISLPSTATSNSNEDSVDDNPGHNHLIIVACQDGSVRLIGYRVLDVLQEPSQQVALHYRDEYTVTVDGPIVCVALNYKAEKGKIEAVIGSLCGYVARFLKKVDTRDAKWEGPYMVAEGFSTASTQVQEDSVLTVNSWQENIAIGTYSGRCLLYGQTNADDDRDYGQPFLDFQLPGPIHSICRIPTESSTLLLITTRKSLHILREIEKRYNPRMAKSVLESLLVMRQQVMKKGDIMSVKS